MERVIIKSDVLNIAKRIREIDKNYMLVFNKITKKFEIFYKNLQNLQLVLPFESLDCRSVEYVLKTRVENHKALIEQIDKHNEELEKENIKKTKEDIMKNMQI